MSDVAIGTEARGPSLLTPRTVVVLLGVGILCFVATLLLAAYGADLGPKRPGGSHALSDAATGYSGIVRLAEATGRHPRIVRDAGAFDTEDLVVAAPEYGATDISPVIGPRGQLPTLIVLPKWQTAADEDHRGWVTIEGLKPLFEPMGVMAPGTKLAIARRRSGGRPLTTLEPLPRTIAFTAPRPVQVITAIKGRSIEPLITDGHGGIVLGKLDNPTYVLADPDLLANNGLRDARNAASALALLDWLNSNEAEGIAFDVTLNGLGATRSPFRLLFDPPFLAMTVALAVAILLAALGTVTRFGSPRLRPRAIAFGKAALVDNAAILVRKARREAALGPRYAEVIREAAARAFGVPVRVRGAALDTQLDRIDGRFTPLAAAVSEARDRASLVAAARALYDWMGNRKR